MKPSRLACLAFALALAALSRRAPAQEAAAEDLFQRGQAKMAAHQYAEACPLFAESYRLDRAGGTLQNLAVCYEELGQWASAHARFLDLRALSTTLKPPRPDRVALADQHIAALAPRLSRVIVDVPAASRLPTLAITIDDVSYAAVTWSDGIVVDPGTHSVVASAPDKKPWSTTIRIGPQPVAQRVTVTVPPLVEAPRLELAPGRDSEPRSATRTPGIIVAASGLAVVGGGMVFGLLALDANQAGKDKCTRTQNLNASADQFDAQGKCVVGSAALREANDDKSRARVFANVANVVVPLGAIAIGLGAYLFFRKPTSASTARLAPLVTPTLGGGLVETSF